MTRMTMSLRRHDKSFMNNTVRRSMSSSEWREVTARVYVLVTYFFIFRITKCKCISNTKKQNTFYNCI